MARFTFGKRFDDAVRWLRQNWSPKSGLPVEVRSKNSVIVRKEICSGSCIFYPGKKWLITLDRSMTGDQAIECLLHEFAHVLQDEIEPASDNELDHHSDQWGILYARLYRGFYYEFGG